MCVPSPLDGLLCLVCMVSVPTTAPMFAVVAAAARLRSVSVCHVFGRLEHAHTLPLPRLLPSSHPPPSNLSRTPITIIPPFMPSHTISQCSSSSLSLLYFLPHSLYPSLQFHCSSIKGCSLPPTFTHKPNTRGGGLSDSVCNRKNVRSLNYE